MLTLVNLNRMQPPIAPVGLDYIASAVKAAGFEADLLDLCLLDDSSSGIEGYFTANRPELVGLSLRNVDDCFWPSATSFVDEAKEVVEQIRGLCDAAIVIGGVGASIFPEEVLRFTGAEFGIAGDGEEAMSVLLREVRGDRDWARVPGLLHWQQGSVVRNPPAWPRELSVSPDRSLVDNPTYFGRGGQIGVETKRGCGMPCIYCADPLAKGSRARLRDPEVVADEIEALLRQDVDVFHLCDAEFNLPGAHAESVCDALIARGLGRRIRWYAYLSILPFSDTLASRMARAGCVGINFTSDSASAEMLQRYRHRHRRKDLKHAVDLCRRHGIRVMLDMLLGGPGETLETVTETIEAFKALDPDCAGASLGVRIYPRTEMERIVRSEGVLETNPNLRRKYDGQVDLLRPTFYISSHLGPDPAMTICEIIGDDERFFKPQVEQNVDTAASEDHNYNANQKLIQSIQEGARGAYWDILRTGGPTVGWTREDDRPG